MQNLTEDDRFVIACELKSGRKQNWIAEQLDCSPSTISREIKRNRCPDGVYRWQKANQRAKDRKRYRTVIGKLLTGRARSVVNCLLLRNWSPEQISNHLRLTGSWLQVSHQTIYKYVWSYPRRHKLRRALRRNGRRPRRQKPGYITRARKERVSIHLRPEIANNRKRCGDWELDLMTCSRNSGYLITAVDRKSGYTLIGRAKTRHSSGVMDGIIKMFRRTTSKQLRQTFTFDNGSEFYYFKRLEQQLGVKVYFADPFNSGQRGTNENTNGLIRQYFPKDRPYASITNREIKRVARLLNNRPRKRLEYQSPKHVFRSPQKIAIQI